ncbi:MAG: hypothetical protein CMJ80_04385 [Planctomycetaceae bacterium]|nr:hypothetical protein [Planctomycetaceae bacterium]
MAKAVPEFAIDSENGTSGTIPDSRCLFLDRQQQSCRRKTLSSDDRRALPKSGAKSDADGA